MLFFCAVMGQGVVWYTGQFCAMSFMQKVMNIESAQVDSLMAAALFIGTPLFVLFGWLSDKVGRKPIMMIGLLLAIFAYRPIYNQMFKLGDFSQKQELKDKFTSEATAKVLEGTKVDSVYTTQKFYADGSNVKEVVTKHLENGKVLLDEKGKDKVETKITKTIDSTTKWTLAFWVFLQVVFVTMVYGPIAAFLVEMFPIRIRYTSMSLPYHIGNGIFGGLLPAVATYLVTSAKDAGNPEYYLQGLWYPIIVAAVSLIIGVIYLDGKDRNVED